MKKDIVLKLAALFVLALFIISSLIENQGRSYSLEETNDRSNAEEISDKQDVNDKSPDVHHVIDIKGAVKKPGVYKLKSGARVVDAIEKAGGFTSEAEPLSVNLAEKVYDEMVIIVRSKEELELEGRIHIHSNEQDKVRLNRASISEIETLPGIGPAKAEAIFRYREEHGPFHSEQDLVNVSGIGKKTVERLRDFVIIP
ncbi:helix-hairpin-helix domain-containing protein [Salirhabdus salicampi]|uniref:helix-hairpin-helix domain-containing protein n=1 Tax=Salirhabdus salicampi TaxID=476102 RepID=UPI0020C420F1|nr:helix-hairpin-helix domain-containing protein [Salirhabdus salicampi]MCP8616927.1 helix-hairpin-helix domain-containing protein [Salirhabdus salicampi]